MLRQQQLITWLHSQFPDAPFELAPASVDASFRRYFRVTFSDRTLIVMDAPPQHEDCRPFIHVAQLFSAAGVHVPQVLAQDLEQGFLLLSDLGNTTYLQALCGSNANTARELYGAAIDALISIQLASRENDLPPYDEALLLREMRLFPAWYIAKHLAVTLSAKQNATLENSFQRIVQNNLAQPRVYVHRDYHSRNLMYIERPLINPLPRIPSPQSSDGTTGETTSHLTNPAKDAGQVIGYSHSTRPSRSDGQVHPQGVRRGCTKGRQSTTQQAACGIDTKELKPQQHTQAGYPASGESEARGAKPGEREKPSLIPAGERTNEKGNFLTSPGILDFQDAVYGPITYDLASLFKDAYIRWEEAEVLDWLISYWEKARKVDLPVHADFADFYRDYEWMAVQRHLKVLGIFARLYHRDGKDGYLQNLPLVMDYLRKACERYIDLKPLLKLLDVLETCPLPQAGEGANVKGLNP